MNTPFVLNVNNTNEPPPPVTHNRAVSSYATKTFSHSHTPTAGPSLDIGLTRGFSLSLSGVYQPIRYVVNHQNTVIIRATPSEPHHISTSMALFQSERFIWMARGHAWEFPIIAKKHFLTGRGQGVFAGAGMTARRAVGTVDYSDTDSLTKTLLSSSTAKASSSRRGIVGSFGLEFPSHGVLFLPEIRYTGWLSKGELPPELHSNYRLEFCVSFFRARR